jgi:pyruvate dehydrogenase (quinone)
MSKKKVADIIIETLQQAGVQRCYGIVGDTLNHITDAIRRSDIEWVHMRHEEAGAMAAGGEALLTGRLTACAGTCGPGSLHFINGLFEAHRNRAPVVLIATQVATSEMGMDFPQEVDLKPIYDTCSHFCMTIHSPAQARRVTALAAQAALNKRGAAVIIVPGDISQMEVDDGLAFRPHQPQPVLRPSDAELDEIAAVLNAGKRITLYCGSGCEGAEREIVALAAKIKAPVAHTSRAKDFIEPYNPYNMGMTGILGVESAFAPRCLRHAAAARCRFRLEPVLSERSEAHPDRQRRHASGPPSSRRYRCRRPHQGHPRSVAAAPARARGAGVPAQQPQASRADAQQLAEEEHPGTDGLIHPQYLTRLIDLHADDDAIFTADGGSPMVWLLRHIPAMVKRRTLTSLVHGTMANAMPEALGIKKALPNRQVISLSGDGGLSMLLGDLLTAVQENIPIKVIVYNNGSLGFVEMEQKVEGLLDAYTELKNPDFAKLAEVIGFYGRRVEHADDTGGSRARCAVATRPGPARRQGQPLRAGDAAKDRSRSGAAHGALFGQGDHGRSRQGSGGTGAQQLRRLIQQNRRRSIEAVVGLHRRVLPQSTLTKHVLARFFIGGKIVLPLIVSANAYARLVASRSPM